MTPVVSFPVCMVENVPNWVQEQKTSLVPVNQTLKAKDVKKVSNVYSHLLHGKKIHNDNCVYNHLWHNHDNRG